MSKETEAPVALETSTGGADETPDGPAEELELTTFDSLEDLIKINREEGVIASAPPDPIILTWSAGAKSLKLPIATRWPKDADTFGLAYIQAQNRADTAEIDKDGKPHYPNAGEHLRLLRRELIKAPTWLHNDSAFKRFAENVPPRVVSSLYRKLRLIGGLDADFFEDFQTNLLPLLSKHSTASDADSGSSPTKSPTDAETPEPDDSDSDSSPNTTTTPSDPPSSSVPSDSTMASGPPQPQAPSPKENGPPTPS